MRGEMCLRAACTVIDEEIGDRTLQHLGSAREAADAQAILAAFVFLHSLKAHTPMGRPSSSCVASASSLASRRRRPTSTSSSACLQWLQILLYIIRSGPLHWLSPARAPPRPIIGFRTVVTHPRATPLASRIRLCRMTTHTALFYTRRRRDASRRKKKSERTGSLAAQSGRAFTHPPCGAADSVSLE
jgi:hypothetical protein